MAEELKYVKTKNEEIIIFPMVIQHDTFKHLEPISAGFCRIRNRKVDCYGESYSLGLKAIIREDSLQATKFVFGVDAMIDRL